MRDVLLYLAIGLYWVGTTVVMVGLYERVYHVRLPLRHWWEAQSALMFSFRIRGELPQ